MRRFFFLDAPRAGVPLTRPLLLDVALAPVVVGPLRPLLVARRKRLLGHVPASLCVMVGKLLHVVLFPALLALLRRVP